jgi:hypothetical protein
MLKHPIQETYEPRGCTVEGKILPVLNRHAMKTYSSIILDLGTGWRLVDSFTP